MSNAGTDVAEAGRALEHELVELGMEIEDSEHAAANLLEAVADLIRAARSGQPVLALVLPVILWLAEVGPAVVDGVQSIHIRLPWDRTPKELREAARRAEAEGKDAKARRLRRRARRRSG